MLCLHCTGKPDFRSKTNGQNNPCIFHLFWTLFLFIVKARSDRLLFLSYQLFNSLIIISFFDILDLLFSYSYGISLSSCRIVIFLRNSS